MVRRALLVMVVSVFVTVHSASSPAHAQTPPLIVALVSGGDLYRWHEDDQTAVPIYAGAAIQPYLAPGGERIAFTVGADGLPGALWVVAGDDAPRELIAPAQVNGAVIDQIAWGDADALYFNTSTVTPFGIAPQDDLWRVDVASGAVTNVLPAGEGGAFSVSPDGARLSIASAGTFDDTGNPATDGAVRVLDVANDELTTLYTFAPLPVPGHVGVYPGVHWLADSTALVASVYQAGGEVALLRLDVDGGAETLQTLALGEGWVNGWSADGQYLSYTRADDAQTAYIIAGADGTNPRTLTDAPVRGFGWAWAGHRFAVIPSESRHTIAVYDPALPDPITLEIDNIDVLRYASLLDDNTYLYGDMFGAVVGVVRFSDNGDVISNTELLRLDTAEMIPLRYDAVFAP